MLHVLTAIILPDKIALFKSNPSALLQVQQPEIQSPSLVFHALHDESAPAGLIVENSCLSEEPNFPNCNASEGGLCLCFWQALNVGTLATADRLVQAGVDGRDL